MRTSDHKIWKVNLNATNGLKKRVCVYNLYTANIKASLNLRTDVKLLCGGGTHMEVNNK